MITGKNIIGFTYSAEGNKTFNAYDASDLTMRKDTFIIATENEVNQAVELAKNAFEQYKNYSGKQKAKFLEEIAEEILELGDELVKTAMAESALPEGRIIGERGRTVNQLKMFAALLKNGSWIEASIDRAQPNREPLPKSDIRRIRQAVGPIVVFGASNFPLAFSTGGGDTASALAAGCPVIVKSHPSHPGTGELVASAIIKAAEKTNMPNGVFSMLNDSGYSVGEKLVTHPEIKGVAFTGSYSGGKALSNLVNNRDEPIPVFAEMGSTNPVFILPEALKTNLEDVANGLTNSITLGVGQFCTNPGLVITIDDEQLQKFISTLSNKIAHTGPGKMLNKNILQNYNSMRNKILKEKGVIIEGSSELEDDLGSPTVVSVNAEVFLTNSNLHKEVFGPFSLIVKCQDIVEMISVAKKLEGQLTATFQAKEKELSENKELINIVREKVGRIIFNGFPTGVEVCASMHHGGPYPASTDSRFTSVGTDAIKRFTRPICYQDWPHDLLPEELKNNNPLNIWRLVDSEFTNSGF